MSLLPHSIKELRLADHRKNNRRSVRHRSTGLFRIAVAVSAFMACTAAANAVNYQNGRSQVCPAANICTLNFPAPGTNLRIDYVTCYLQTTTAAPAWVITVFNGVQAAYLTTQPQDANIRRSFTVSNQIRYFSGAGPFTIEARLGAFVDSQISCTVTGVR